jgi:hypothetical protein
MDILGFYGVLVAIANRERAGAACKIVAGSEERFRQRVQVKVVGQQEPAFPENDT